MKRIEELLNKAQKVYSKATTNEQSQVEQVTVKRQISIPAQQQKPKQKDENEPNTKLKSEEKPPTALKSRLPLAKAIINKKVAAKPVYMSAPYKTESVNTFKAAKPKTILIKTSASTSELKKNENIEEQPSSMKYSSQTNLIETVGLIKSSSTAAIENQFTFSLKTNGAEMRLPPETENLVVKNFRLKQTLLKSSGNQGKSSQSREHFREKLEKSCFKQSSPAFLHYLINKMCFIYNNLIDFVKLVSSECELLHVNDTNDDLNKLKIIKLHLFYDKLELFESKLCQQFDAINLQIKTFYKLIGKNFNLIENKIFSIQSENNNNNFISDLTDERLLNFMPISYKNEAELKKYFNLKLNLIELEFKNLYLTFLDDLYLNNYFKTNLNSINDTNFIEQFNLLFGIVTDKRTIIVKQ